MKETGVFKDVDEQDDGDPQTKMLDESNNKKTSDFEQFKKYEDINSLLGFGKFQHFQIWVFQMITAVLGAITYFQVFFIVSEPPHWYCKAEEGVKADKCLADGSVCGGGQVVYNTSHINHMDSLVVYHQWHCDKELWGANVITATAFGGLCNDLVFGQLSDRLGRTKIIHITTLTFLIFRLIALHVTDHYIIFLVLIALSSSFFPVGVRSSYSLVAEYCDDNGRKYAFISGWVWWVFGMVLIPFLAEWLNDWYVFGMVTTLLNLLVVAMFPFVPESPRLLLNKKQFKRAAAVIAQIRRWNSDEKVENLEEILKAIYDKNDIKQELGFMSIFREKALRRILLCMIVLFGANNYFYFAGQLNSRSLAGSLTINYALMALTELPSVFIGQFIIDRLGRRWSHVLCMTCTAVSFLVNVIVVNLEGTDNVVFTFSILARTASNVGWFVMWVQAIEVFPTVVRNQGISLSGAVSICINMTSAYVISLNDIDKRLPYAVFVFVGVCGMVASSLVPETKGETLPETVTQLEQMIRDMRYLEFRPWLRRREEKGGSEERRVKSEE